MSTCEMEPRWPVVLARSFALVAARVRRGRARADRRRRRPTAEEFPAGTTMAELQEAGEIDDRREVRRTAVRVQEPADRRGRGLRRRSRPGDRRRARRGAEVRRGDLGQPDPVPQDGTADLILSTMTITTDRDAEIDFSIPYYIAKGRVLVPKDSDIAGRRGPRRARRSARRPARRTRRTCKEHAPDAKLRLVDTYSECLELMQTGAGGRRVHRRRDPHRDDHPGRHAEARRRRLTTEPYGAGIADGDTEFQEFVDERDRRLHRGRPLGRPRTRSGSGSTPGEPQDPPTMTLEEALELRPCEETC